MSCRNCGFTWEQLIHVLGLVLQLYIKPFSHRSHFGKMTDPKIFTHSELNKSNLHETKKHSSNIVSGSDVAPFNGVIWTLLRPASEPFHPRTFPVRHIPVTVYLRKTHYECEYVGAVTQFGECLPQEWCAPCRSQSLCFPEPLSLPAKRIHIKESRKMGNDYHFI